MRRVLLLTLTIALLAGLVAAGSVGVYARRSVKGPVSGTSALAVSHGYVQVVAADTFSTDGDFIGGWYWLRDAAFQQYGKWEFSGIPSAGVVGNCVYIRFDPLVTNTVSGGSGYSTLVSVIFTKKGGGTITKCVLIVSTHPEFQEPRYTQDGWGYAAFGWIKVPVKQVPVDGKMTVTLVRKKCHPYHTAVNDGACTIEYVTPGTPSPVYQDAVQGEYAGIPAPRGGEPSNPPPLVLRPR
jgi:hypothetical protein